jgi:integrase
MGAPVSTIGGIHTAGIEPAENGKRTGGSDRLTDAECRNAKPDVSVRKLSDGKGLYLAIMPNGAKLWRVKYRHDGKERVYSIGPYDEIGLARAREERDRARDWLKAGKDPTIERRVAKANAAAQQATSFRAVGDEFLAKQQNSERHARTQKRLLEHDIYPVLGNLPVAEVEQGPSICLEALKRIERRGTLEMAAKAKRLCSQIMRYAVATARAKSDPFLLLNGALKPPATKHRATIPLVDMPALFKAMAKVPAEANTKLAFYLTLLTAARTGETRFATWGEIHGDRWRVPAERMKMRRDHVVPLSKQAAQILALAKPLRQSDDAGALIFPGFTRHGALSENALLALLARAGFYGRQTTHGFRASFSTWAHEEYEAAPDVIEACLAHTIPGVRGDYNRATYLSKRRELLQAWADQCDAWGMRIA